MHELDCMCIACLNNAIDGIINDGGGDDFAVSALPEAAPSFADDEDAAANSVFGSYGNSAMHEQQERGEHNQQEEVVNLVSQMHFIFLLDVGRFCHLLLCP